MIFPERVFGSESTKVTFSGRTMGPRCCATSSRPRPLLVPPFSCTKSLTGHAQGAAGACEAIYTLLMMKHRFIAASANIDNLDPEADGMPIARTRIDDADLALAMSNSFGFGGTNASLVFRRFDG